MDGEREAEAVLREGEGPSVLEGERSSETEESSERVLLEGDGGEEKEV